jgi:hypothetical protein
MRIRALRHALFTLCLVGPCLAPSHACARHVRPLFEPTDLEIEQPGVFEGDLQMGVVRGEDGPLRIVVPDFELDLGLLPNVELDLDGAYAIEGGNHGAFSFDHAAPDSLWLAGKFGFYDAHDDAANSAFAIGMQLGPKWPIAVAAHGVGAEGLLLVSTGYSIVHAVWNAGGFIDPAPDSRPGRPRGIELGTDVDIDLDSDQIFSLNGGLSIVHFFSQDAAQLLTSAGITWSVTDTLDLSVTAMVGWLAGGDRYGVLLGVSPKFQLF